MVQVVMLILGSLVFLAGCAEYHQPLVGPHSDPLTYPAVRGQNGGTLPSLPEIPTGLANDYQAYPILEPDEIVRVWAVGKTKSDILHVHGHWLTINYRPSRFKPDDRVTRNRVPTGRLLTAPTKLKDNPESSQPQPRTGQASPVPPSSTTAAGRSETQAVQNAYQQIQRHMKQSGAGQALEQQIREMTRQIQQQTGASNR